MARPTISREKVERGITKITRRYDDGRISAVFQIRYGDGAGGMVSETFSTAAKARSALAKARTRVMDGEHIDPSTADTKLLAVAQDWLAHHPEWKARTRAANESTVNVKLKPLHDKRMKQITKATVLAYRTQLVTTPERDGGMPAPSSVRRSMAILSAICEHARITGSLSSNPCRDLPKIKVRKREVTMPSPEQVEALIAHLSLLTPEKQDSQGRTLKAKPADPRWALLVETAAYTGLRAGELAGLKKGDLSDLGRRLVVRRTIINDAGDLREDTPKSEAGRRVVEDLDPDLWRGIQDLTSGLSRGDYVFGWIDSEGTSQPYRHANFYHRVFRPACEELGIDCTSHDLRHFQASLLISWGWSPVDVAERLGHESPSFTLDTYAHLFKNRSTGVGQKTANFRAEVRGEKPVKQTAAKEAPTRGKKPF